MHIYYRLGNLKYLATFSMCFCKNLENTIYFTEYEDTDLFTETEAILVQINPYECVIPRLALIEYQKFEEVAKNHNILISQVKSCKNIPNISSAEYKNCSDFKSVSELIDSESISLLHKIDIDMPEVYKCLSVLLTFFKASFSDKVGTYHLSIFNRFDLMCLDSSALKSLSVLPDTNECRLDMVEYFVESQNIAQELNVNLYLKNLPDLNLIVNKLNRSRAGLIDCVKIYFSIKKIPEILNILKSHNCNSKNYKAVETNIVQPLEDISKDIKKYCLMIESLVDLNVGVGEEYKIRNDVDDNLNQIQENIFQLDKKIDNHAAKICDNVGLELGKTFKKEYSSRRGYYFRVTLKASKSIDENKFNIFEALKDGIHFVDSKMKEYSDELCSFQKEYKNVQSQFVKDMINVACEYVKLFQLFGNIIGLLDVIISFSFLPCSTSRKFVRPQLLNSEHGLIYIRNGRHPCMEMSCDLPFISNDLELDKKNNYFSIITGPNMGGKSTYLRQCALIILMSQIGSFVPCESAKISLVDKIITRVGASDYQLKGLSTFMAEMVDACSILRSATSESFVIVDELGRGTSTYDGFGLGWSIAEYIATEIKCFTLFATHFHEITELESIHSGIKNYQVYTQSDKEELIMCYKVISGYKPLLIC
ncbi:hypothetical protein HZS_4758 [Henneguya salminicola]|nr:hypothetical protein HZS_4758 [Henneguya salminicola]